MSKPTGLTENSFVPVFCNSNCKWFTLSYNGCSWLDLVDALQALAVNK
jgi:hypothetical protein